MTDQGRRGRSNSENGGGPPRSLSAVTREDPTLSLPVGSTLVFEANLFPPIVNTVRAFQIANWEFTEGVVLALHYEGQGSVTIDGSAVIVAPGIALTAKHVIEPRLGDLLASRVSLRGTGITSHGLQLWGVDRVTIIRDSDLALLTITLISDLPPGNRFHQATITTRLPTLGEPAMVLGFRPTCDQFDVSEGQPAGMAMRAGVGPVTERFPQRRDSAMLPWPTLALGCSTMGSMSGGPVFDMFGKLVGILSSSYDMEDGQGPSYASLIWPALSHRIEPVWPRRAQEEAIPQSLLEVGSPVCAIDRPSAIEVEYDSQSNMVTTTYAAWDEVLEAP